ncbi:ABC transporter ATP-binding protein [Micromonospora taraxaci]|uniref:Putative ABC transport system ATP-binding protein n=1 Tax=Micromonospora taraxaci TaxID=1316803 RepID=A0A561VXQ9_9ACTN|nr:ABC transporter ATP-binding protein [Micromonospora taraxaci]TWG16398.1 putative ABC transport system ATP-binding protein [Micromonospora taraxaci]
MTNDPGLPLLEISGVSRCFSSPAETIWAVRDANLRAFPGEFVCIFGTSGSGKSTLLNTIAGLDIPDRGRVLVESTDLARLDEDQRAQMRLSTIGVVFQDYNLVEEFTAAENVALPLEVRGMASTEARRLADEQLERVGLGGLGNRLAVQFSGGQRQRIGIARALIGDRRILVADEPTGALDSQNSRALFKLLRELCDQGTLVIVCSHDTMTQEFADTVYEMVDGQLLRRESSMRENGVACSQV